LKLLAVDTAAVSCSVAVTDDANVLTELTIVAHRTHSKHVMGLIAAAIDQAGLRISEIDGFAATNGPGTFTGLRIGISTVMGLAAAYDKPAVGVSSLKALASQTVGLHLICPLLDAKRQEVYFSRFRWKDGHLMRVAPELAGPLQRALDCILEPCVFIGSGARLYREAIEKKMGSRAQFVPDFQNSIRASAVARIGLAKLLCAGRQPGRRILPNYLRKSDAELNLGRHSTPDNENRRGSH
jgi:tRNA threonylcarbamoyladenosine biosynthesis protein TsaB